MLVIANIALMEKIHKWNLNQDTPKDWTMFKIWGDRHSIMLSQPKELLKLFLHKEGKIYIANSSGFPCGPWSSIESIKTYTEGGFDVISSASWNFGLPSTIQMCDLPLISFKKEFEQYLKQWFSVLHIGCGVGIEISDLKLNLTDLGY